MDKLTRRSFLKRSALASLAGAAVLAGRRGSAAAGAAAPKATLIEVARCDGCAGRDGPQCVLACRRKNAARFPEPQKPLLDYWPRKGYEDWSGKRQATDRLTPYNWLYVQTVRVEGRTLNIVRRCMHCDNPPCARLCPFGAIEAKRDGSVVIDAEVCFGGAKCRDVCPWGIPARQAGVGLYMKLAPQLAGGGVMYKCDQCHDLIAAGERPACVAACPRGAMTFGGREEIRALTEKRRGELNGHVYGVKENGGTATFYLSPVPFAAIDEALRRQGHIDGKPGRPGMPAGIANRLEELDGWGRSVLIAPVATAVAAGWAAYRTLNAEGGEDGE
jgi:Fe-S-cluster-containing dehydrogenase component